MSDAHKDYNKTSVILVHGIGDTSPGSVLDPAVLEIGRQLEGVTQQKKKSISSESTNYSLLSQSLRWENFQLDLIEFHWSGAAGKIRRSTFLSSSKHLVSMLWNLPRLGAWGSQSVIRHTFANFFGAYLVLSLFVILFFSVWTMTSGVYESLELDSHEFESVENLFLILLFGAFLLAATIAFVLIWGNRKITQWAAQWLGVAIGNLFVSYIWFIFIFSFAILLTVFHEVVDVEIDFVSLAALILVPLVLAPFYFIVRSMAGIADLFRDVIHYLVVDKDGNDHKDTAALKSGLHELISSLIKKGDDRIVLVAHSLGTAITAEVLLERTKVEGQEGVTFEFATCGSPLKRLLHRLLPQRIPHPDDMFDQLKAQTSFNFGSWINIHRTRDPVGMGLSGRKLQPALTQSREELAGITDVKIEPVPGKTNGHSNYWSDPRFLNILIDHFLRPGSKRAVA